MKHSINILLLVVLLHARLLGQTDPINAIRSGFYINLGPVFPTGKYATEQKVVEHEAWPPDTLIFPRAKIGGAMDMGFLIYIGPAFASNKLRVGIDATFLSVWFNSSNPYKNYSEDYHKLWYYYVGQKFGPVFSINPVDRLIIDLGYKINAYMSWHADTWGSNIFQQEVSLHLRYRIMMFGLLYNFGSVNYDDWNDANPNYWIPNATFRVMIGFKF